MSRQHLHLAPQATVITAPIITAIEALVVPGEIEIASILASIRGVIAKSGWSHTDAGKYTIEEINDAIYYLTKQGEEDD